MRMILKKHTVQANIAHITSEKRESLWEEGMLKTKDKSRVLGCGRLSIVKSVFFESPVPSHQITSQFIHVFCKQKERLWTLVIRDEGVNQDEGERTTAVFFQDTFMTA